MGELSRTAIAEAGRCLPTDGSDARTPPDSSYALDGLHHVQYHRCVITYAASLMDLKNILQWLRGSDESQWNDTTRLLSETISNLQDMVQQTRERKTERPAAESNSFSAEANAINVAMPKLTQMWEAMHIRNRGLALKNGEEALALLPVE